MSTLLRLPGLIDPHVHFRDPGQTHKEDFYTGTAAAIAGGFTTVIDMPNNVTPTFTLDRLEEKIKLSQEKAICDVGFHYGTNGLNSKTFPHVWGNPHVYGLKIYCNHTTGELLIEDLALLEEIYASWKSEKPILVHAEGMQLAGAIALAHLYSRRLHVCHISQAAEVELVRRAKQKKIHVTAGVTPHHLFLVDTDVTKLGSFARMKPPLGTKTDQIALWEGIQDGTIDLIETDHAPHTREEKKSASPPYGVPGLETMLPLLLTAVKQKRLTLTAVIQLTNKNPQKIFGITQDSNTYIEVDAEEKYEIQNKNLFTKCGWSPFAGWKVQGRIKRVYLRGTKVFEDGNVLV